MPFGECAGVLELALNALLHAELFGDQEAVASLLSGVEEKLVARLPDPTWVCPGHGNDTTLGAGEAR